MATYYRWNQSEIEYYAAQRTYSAEEKTGISRDQYGRQCQSVPSISSNGFSGYLLGTTKLDWSHTEGYYSSNRYFVVVNSSHSGGSTETFSAYYSGTMYLESTSTSNWTAYDDLIRYTLGARAGTFKKYIYSLENSTYPNGGVSGGNYYSNRTSIVSPTAPDSITYPNSITNQAISITFTEATSEIPDYSVDEYEISYNVNESSWVVAGTTKELSYSFNIPSVFTSNIMFRVRAKDTNGQWGDYKTGAIASVSLPALPPPVLTLPSSPVKINESFSISWTSISEATGYILQKKKINDSDWSELYNGTLLSYTDTANDLGLYYRISYKVNEFQSEWSQEYSLNTFEKLIEISYLDESGSYVPLYPVTSTVAVFNTNDLVNLTLSSGTYQGNGFEINNIALENSVDPKVAIITNSKQETTLVTNFNENNMTVKDSNNELGETYNYVIIGNNKNK